MPTTGKEAATDVVFLIPEEAVAGVTTMKFRVVNPADELVAQV